MTHPPRLGARSRPSITIGGGERAFELTSWRIFSDSGADAITSAYEGQEGRVHWLEGESFQSTASGSLWRLAEEHTGEEVSFLLAPHGNVAPTDDRPHYAGTLIVGPPADLGGASTERDFLFAFTWRIKGAPTRTPAHGAT